MVVICFVFVKRASKGAAIRAGSKLECVELRYISFLRRIHFLSAKGIPLFLTVHYHHGLRAYDTFVGIPKLHYIFLNLIFLF